MRCRKDREDQKQEERRRWEEGPRKEGQVSRVTAAPGRWEESRATSTRAGPELQQLPAPEDGRDSREESCARGMGSSVRSWGLVNFDSLWQMDGGVEGTGAQA